MLRQSMSITFTKSYILTDTLVVNILLNLQFTRAALQQLYHKVPAKKVT